MSRLKTKSSSGAMQGSRASPREIPLQTGIIQSDAQLICHTIRATSSPCNQPGQCTVHLHRGTCSPQTKHPARTKSNSPATATGTSDLQTSCASSNGSRRSNGAACQKKQLTSAGSSPIAVMLRQRWQQPIAVIQWVPFVHVLICRIESDGVRFHVLLCHRCQKAESEQCTAHMLHDTSDLHTTARYRHQPEQCLGHFGCCPK